MSASGEAEKEDQTGHLCAQEGEGEARVGPVSCSSHTALTQTSAS